MLRRPPTALCQRLSSPWRALLRRFRGSLADRGPRRIRPPYCNRRRPEPPPGRRCSARVSWRPPPVGAAQSKLSSLRPTRASRAGSPSLSMRSPASLADPLRGSRQGAFKGAPLARGPSDGRGKERRSELSPSLPQRPSWRVASEGVPCREPRPRTLQSLPSCPTSLRATSGGKRQGATPLLGYPRPSLSRARSWRTRFQLRSASPRSSGQDAGRNGQAGRLAPRPAG